MCDLDFSPHVTADDQTTETVHYLKHTVYLKTWWNKVLVQISFDFEQETWTFKNGNTSEQKHD